MNENYIQGILAAIDLQIFTRVLTKSNYEAAP
jgi:hypothetical protein